MTIEFDIAVSFAGEDRDYVERFVTACKTLKVEVFYDRDMAVSWWGKDFVREQRKIYGAKARYFMPFISEHYLKKPIPTDEFTAALARSVELFGDFILPVKLGNVIIPRDLIPPSIHYINAKGISPEKLAEMAYERIFGSASNGSSRNLSPQTNNYRKPVAVITNFSPYKSGAEIIDYVDSNLTLRMQDLESSGYGFDRIVRDGIIGFRLRIGSELAFSLDIWHGLTLNDAGIGFLHGTGRNTL